MIMWNFKTRCGIEDFGFKVCKFGFNSEYNPCIARIEYNRGLGFGDIRPYSLLRTR